MTLLGNAKPTPEQLAQFRKNADKGRIWIYQNLEPGHADWGKLIFLQQRCAPPAQVTDPVDGTMWRYRLVGYILDLKTGEIGECRSTMTPDPPPAPRKPKRKVIEGPWGKRTIEPPKESETPPAPPNGAGRVIDHGLAKPDDPIYSLGPVVNGRPILKPRETGTVKVTVGGSLPPDHPIFSRGPMIFGRPNPPPKKEGDRT